MNKQMQKSGGYFTLIELLIVVGIIAILAGLLLPALNKARDKAKVAACVQNFKQLAVAAFSYANDNQGYMPPLRNDNTPYQVYKEWHKTNGPPGAYLFYTLKYVSSRRAINCPAKYENSNTKTSIFWNIGIDVYTSLDNIKKIDKKCKVMFGDLYYVANEAVTMNHNGFANWTHVDGSVKTYTRQQCKYVYADKPTGGKTFYAPYQLWR